MKEPISEEIAEPCAICKAAAWVANLPPKFALWQVHCPARRHRTRFYFDRRSAVMAWNVNQRHKVNQENSHG